MTPPADLDSDFTLRVTATATEGANGSIASTSADVAVAVSAVADAPDLATTGGSGAKDTAIGFSFASGLTDVDGSETLSVTLSDVPSGAGHQMYRPSVRGLPERYSRGRVLRTHGL